MIEFADCFKTICIIALLAKIWDVINVFNETTFCILVATILCWPEHFASAIFRVKSKSWHLRLNLRYKNVFNENNILYFGGNNIMFDLNTLSVLKSGSKSKSWHLRLSDVRGHHNADFGPLTQVPTDSMYICHRIHQNIMEQLWLMDVINLILLLFLLLGMILVIYHWYLNIAPYSMHVLHLWFQSWSWSWSLVGSRRTGGRASWAGTVGYRELSDGGAGHLQGPQSSIC